MNNTEITAAISSKSRERLIMIGLAVAIVATVLISLTMGRYSVPLEQIFTVFKEKFIYRQISDANKEAHVILFVIRIPRILMSVIVGASLAMSGAAYQGLFKNPMVSPDILGVSTGAGMGASLAILLGLSSLSVQLMAFSFGLGAVILVITLSKAISKGQNNLLIIVLAGTVISSVFNSFTSLIKFMADPSDNKLPAITFWLMGSFARSGSYKNVIIMIIAFTLGAVPLFLLRWKMNVVSFSEEEAQAMGINTRAMRNVIIFCSTLLTASSVSLCGIIGWVGMIIPHISRLMVGPNYEVMLPTACLSGGLFMLIVDNISRTIIPGELPIGVITSLIGAPLFVYMLYKGRSDWA